MRIVKAAEADAEAKFLAGQGIARQRQVGGRAPCLHACRARPSACCPACMADTPPSLPEQSECVRSAAAHSTTAAAAPCVQAIIAGLRESVQTFATEVTDVNSRDVMELLVRGGGRRRMQGSKGGKAGTLWAARRALGQRRQAACNAWVLQQ